jgi:hypothetical protein
MYFAAAERPKQPHDTNPIKAQIAQLVEQLAFNQLVQGSSPCLRTIFIIALFLTSKALFVVCDEPRCKQCANV